MTLNPKQLFLIDGLGAILSAFLLGIVLVRFEQTFGMHRKVLYLLSAIACVFVVYSLTCHFRLPRNWRPYLKAIATANLLYCCLTLGLVIFLYPELTGLGVLYFVLEIIVIVILVFVEFKTVANRLERSV